MATSDGRRRVPSAARAVLLAVAAASTRLPRTAASRMATCLALVTALVALLCATAAAAPVTISGGGQQQDAVVDRDGTLHVVWNERTAAPNPYLTHYCQIPRGGGACVQQHTFAGVPDADNPGPRVMVTAFGDVVVLTHRFPVDRNYVFVNAEGGVAGNWSSPQPLGSVPPSGDAGAIYDDLGTQVLTISGLQTFGVFFQAQRLGAGAPARSAQLGAGTLPRDGTLAQTGPKAFMVAFADGGGNVYVRRFECTACPAADANAGINDAANWTAPQIVASAPGAEQTKLATGPSGTFLAYRAGGPNDRQYEVRKWLGGDAWSAPAVVSDHGDVQLRDFFQDATGTLHFGYDDVRHRLVYRRSPDGVTWSDVVVIASHEGQIDTFGQPRLAARAGVEGFAGFMTWSDLPTSPDGFNRTIYAEALPELVGFPGDGGGGGGGDGGGGRPAPPPPPDPCRTLSFGPVDLVASVCFRRRGALFVATGTLKVNGLSLAPGSGAGEIRIDPRRGTIESSGAVRIEAGDVLLWRGEIDWRVPLRVRVADLLTLDVGRFGGNLFGFGLEGRATLRLVRGAASIPVHVGLPKILGGVTGDVDLRVDNVAGLHVHELTIGAERALLGPVEVRRLRVHYNPDEEVWDGAATLVLPPQPPGPSLAAELGFRRGGFDHAGATLTFPSPGIALGGAVYLTEISFKVETNPALRITGGVGISAGPQVAGASAVRIKGRLILTFPSPPPAMIIRAEGDVFVVDIRLLQAYVEFRTNGYFELGALLDYQLAAFQAKGELRGFVDRTGAFNFEAVASVCVGDYGCAGGSSVISSTGFAGCVELVGLDMGGGYRWGDSFELMFSSCDIGPYRSISTVAAAGRGTPDGVRDGRDGGGAPVARASATSAGFRLPAGLPGEVIALEGTTAAPSVTLTGPGGRTVVTPDSGPLRSADAVAFHDDGKRMTYVVVKRPAAGDWSVALNPGSSEIANVRVADALPEPQVRATVGGRGRERVLRWRAVPEPGQQVRFVERGPDTGRSIGVARGRAGTLRFRPADGQGGRRQIVALVTQDGRPRDTLTVASYVAPPPLRPAVVRGVRASSRGGALRVSWRGARGAARYHVRAQLNDGRSLLWIATGRQRRATLPDVASSVAGSITVAGVRADGLAGKAGRARLRAVRRARPRTRGRARRRR